VYRPTLTLLQLRTSCGCILPRNDWLVTSFVFKITPLHGPHGNTVSHCCGCMFTASLPGNRAGGPHRKQIPFYCFLYSCLQSCCLATRWSNPLQYKSYTRLSQCRSWVEWSRVSTTLCRQHLSESGSILFTVTGLNSLRVVGYGMDSLGSWHPLPNFSEHGNAPYSIKTENFLANWVSSLL
jgi:hypothetical protein